jgi:hypothetical protein
LLAARFFVLVVEGRELLQVFRFEYGVAVETAHVVDTIPPHQELRALMITVRHKKQTIIPILMKAGVKSRPRKRRSGIEGLGAAAWGRPLSG